jgi:glycosyltransferase involved in cell wall biosynthesis
VKDNISMTKGNLTIFMPSLAVGGAEMVVIRLLEGLVKRGIQVDLVLATKYGDLRHSIPNDVRIIDLDCSRTIFSLFKLMRYLRNNKPAKLLSHLHRSNRIAILAKILTRTQTEIYLVNHTTISIKRENSSLLFKLISALSYKYLYKRATKLIHVSKGAARDLENELQTDEGAVSVIYNPIVNMKMLNCHKDYSKPHPWFRDENIPIILSVGRFRRLKGYDVLIDAFYLLQKKINARLIILGDGRIREELEDQVDTLKLKDKVYMPGVVHNVYEYMYFSSVFVLASRWEALPTVLVEALACGCTVVSTDCPHGPSEILESGKYGYLVPVDNSIKLSYAIETAINNPIPEKICIRRAEDFSVEKATDRYIKELNL